MKISYILQLKDFLIMLAIGFIIGIIYGILNIITVIKKNYAVQILSDTIFTIISFATFLISVNIVNWGQIRLFLLVGYLFGYAIERITLGKLFAKGYKKVYTGIVKFGKFFVKSKLGKVIFK